MYERYETVISNEKRLESVSQPAMSLKKRKDQSEEKEKEQDEIDDKKKNSKRKKMKTVVINEKDLKNVKALEENDEVNEGIEWSDDERSISDGNNESE